MITVRASVNLWFRIISHRFNPVSYFLDVPLDYIGDRTRKHLQSFRHLQCNYRSLIFTSMVYRFVDFK